MNCPIWDIVLAWEFNQSQKLIYHLMIHYHNVCYSSWCYCIMCTQWFYTHSIFDRVGTYFRLAFWTYILVGIRFVFEYDWHVRNVLKPQLIFLRFSCIAKYIVVPLKAFCTPYYPGCVSLIYVIWVVFEMLFFRMLLIDGFHRWIIYITLQKMSIAKSNEIDWAHHSKWLNDDLSCRRCRLLRHHNHPHSK